MFIGKPLGRRRSILLGDTFVIVGGSLQASSWSVPQIIIARVLCGFGIGLISCTVLTYMSEMSITKTQRGDEAAIQSVWLIGGVALAYWLDFGFTQMDNQVSWRFPIALQSLFAFVSLCLMVILPDTPRWYYSQCRYDDGDRVLESLHGQSLESDVVRQQKDEILEAIALEDSHAKLNILDLVWDRSDLKSGRRLRIAFLILAIQQLMGQLLVKPFCRDYC